MNSRLQLVAQESCQSCVPDIFVVRGSFFRCILQPVCGIIILILKFALVKIKKMNFPEVFVDANRSNPKDTGLYRIEDQ
jgi:hypothetical protein